MHEIVDVRPGKVGKQPLVLEGGTYGRKKPAVPQRKKKRNHRDQVRKGYRETLVTILNRKVTK